MNRDGSELPAYVFPTKSCTPVNTLVRYSVAAANGVVGVNIAVRPSVDSVIDPGMSTPLLFNSSCIDPVETVNGLIDSVKVNSTLDVVGTPVAPFVGLILDNVGRVVSGTADVEVVKLLLNGTMALPTRSVKPATSTS